MLSIIICCKQVPDPEAPPSGYRVSREEKRVILPPGTPPVISPFDEKALEIALRIKDVCEATITVVSMGPKLSKAILTRSLACGADELVLIQHNLDDVDSYATAFALAAASRKINRFDLILCGIQAADWDAGQVGLGIAELLGIPSISSVRKVEMGQGVVRAERIVADGYEVVEAPLPALITVGSGSGDLRTPSLRDLVAARSKPVTTWSLDELGLSSEKLLQLSRTELLSLSPPLRKEVKCDIVGGETPEMAGADLALRLREAGLI